MLIFKSQHTYLGGGLDIQKFITKLSPGLPWAKYRGEYHIPGHNFSGPGTSLIHRMNLKTGQPYPNSRPINRVDLASSKHDLLYYKYKDLPRRHQADLQMIQELQNIPNPTLREKIERAFVIKILQQKRKWGLGLSI